MTEELSAIHCNRHGEATATYVCGHLCRQPAQRWFCDMPAPDCPFPDAWCASCQAALEREGGEWNERNEDCLDLQIICHHCYQDSMAQSVGAMADAPHDAWVDAVTESHQALVGKQDALETDHGISRFERWDYDQVQGTLTFSHAGVPRLVADIEFIGSISRTSGTWLWAWANFHNDPQVVARIPAVWEWGDERGFAPLTVPRWEADETDGWELAGVAAQVLGALGVYRAPTQNGFLFMALMSLRALRPPHAPAA
ncbi:hypothetical protein KW843_21535 [Acidovorax sp. sif1233]|uniref:DUF6882 domain-containing protein n=1 Tax=unclassified Acidovorax TaxID=2684926 RepID=UPI001C476803|nr:DUF6882 domain-containing protein [Acidovorax sp. sif1233]MBV7457080.1 hypothetical protein [Acidovorax sp. sif1233]